MASTIDFADISEGFATAEDLSAVLAQLGRINSGLYPFDRPGDSRTAFTTLETGGDPDNLPPITADLYPVRAVADGLGIELAGSRTIWTRRYTPIGSGRLVRLRTRFVRTVNPTDPSNDSIQLVARWYDANREPFGNGVALDTTTLAVGASPHEVTIFVGSPGTLKATLNPPVGASYLRIGLHAFGLEGRTVVTDLSAVDITDIGDAVSEVQTEVGDAVSAVEGAVSDLSLATPRKTDPGIPATRVMVGGGAAADVDAAGRPFQRVGAFGQTYALRNGMFGPLLSEIFPAAPGYLNDQVTGITVPSARDVMLMFTPFGESYAAGESGDANDTASTTVAPYPDDLLMFDVGVRPQGQVVSSFVSCLEAKTGVQKETIGTQFGAAIEAGFVLAIGRTHQILMSVTGISGQIYSQLRRGTAGYLELLRTINEAVRIAMLQESRIIVPAIPMLLGVNDWGANTLREAFARDLVQFRANIEADIRALTGQTEPVYLVVTQANRGSLTARQDPRTPTGLLDASALDPLIVPAGPLYWVRRAPGDPQHPAGVGYADIGSMVGRACLQAVFGNGFQPCKIIDAYWTDATHLRLVYNRSITIDTSGAQVATAGLGSTAGFQMEDFSGTPPAVTGVTLVSGQPSLLDLTFAGAPATRAGRLFYACLATTEAYDARGLIRTAASFGDSPSGGGALYDWACVQTYDLRG